MIKILSFITVFALLSYLPVYAIGRDGGGGGGGSNSGGGGGGSFDSPRDTGNGGYDGNYSSGRSAPSANTSNVRGSNTFRYNGNSWTRGWGYNRNGVRSYSGWGSYNRSFNGTVGDASRYRASTVVPGSWKSVGVQRRPASVLNTQMPNIASGHTAPAFPGRGPNGSAFHASLVSPRSNAALVRTNMNVFSNNGAFRAQVTRFNGTENRAGQYYWHSWNGYNYCHYYDAFGCNWYGWYFGSSFFWSCWYGDYWWWYDPAFARWCYWDNGYWWWQNPYDVNETDVYDNGNYVPENQSSSQPAADTIQKPLSQGIYASPDGTRRVEVMGNDQDAFLYDTADPPAFKPVYLASNVKKVTFTNKGKDSALQVVVVTNDGKTQRFDDSGQAAGK